MDLSSSPADLASEQHETKLIDLRQFWTTLRRHQWWMLSAIAVVLVLAAVSYIFVPKRYSASASVALDRRVDELVAQGKDAGNANLPTDSSSVDTEVQVLTSPAVMARVVDKLDLAARPGIGQLDNGPPVPLDQARRRAVKMLMAAVQVKRTGTSYAINVTYSSPDPVLSAAVVNATVDEYVARQRSGKVDERARNVALLRERLATLRNDVIRAEAAVAQYRARTNLVDIDKDSTSAQQEISVLNTQLATAQAERAAAQARLSAGAGSAEVSPSIGALRTQQAQLSAQHAELAGRYGPLHPDLARIDRQLADVNASIDKELTRVRGGLAADARVSEGRAAAIRGALNAAQGRLLAGNNASVQLNELERNSESSRALYQSLLDRYREAVAGQGTERSNAYVIAHALVPSSPSFPTPLMFGVGGLLAALIAAGATVIVLELLERGVTSRQDVESKLGLPVVASVPDLDSVPGVRIARDDPMAPANHLVENPASVFGEAFRTIRTTLHLGHGENGPRSIAVCSALPNEGKTTTAICLARSAALAGARALLVDCDLRRRASSRTMAAQATAGLTQVLRGEVSIDKAILRDEASGAWILPQGDDAGGHDLITQPVMRDLLAALSQRFDLVVLDTAPVLALAEARAISAMVDGVLLAVRWRKTPVHASQLAAELLTRARARVLGVAMTRVNVKQQARAGYGDEMIYYKEFKQYYS